MHKRSFALVFLLVPLALLAVTATTARSALPTFAIPMYEVQYLGALPGAPGAPQAINEAGDVVGAAGFPTHAFVWREGSGMVALPPLPGYTQCEAWDINDVGEVAGTCGADVGTEEPSRAVRWLADGTPQNLGSLYGGRYSHGYGINELGNVIGASSTSPTNTIVTHPFIFTDEDGLIDLTPGLYGAVRGYDINDVGPIGEAVGSGSSAFRWRNGTLEWLPDVPNYPTTFAFAINDLGQIAGTGHSASGNAEKAVRWTDGLGWEILGGVGQDNKSWGINDHGTVVGTGRPFAGAQRAFIYENGSGMHDLNQFVATPGWFIGTAKDINNAGMIVGYGSHSSGLYGAVRLVPISGPGPTPTPPPPTATAAPPTATSVPPTPPGPTVTATVAPPTATPVSGNWLYLPFITVSDVTFR